MRTASPKSFEAIRKELAKIVVGQEKVLDHLILALVGSGNVLLEGVPGIAKTLMVRALAGATNCTFSRIQFTADMLPADIVGITAYDKQKGFYVLKGPVFANFLLADEINRAPPKTQSALLESMQERQATIGKQTFPLPTPFFVLATQNPIENLGTYPLPEAQVDRFLLKLSVTYPSRDEEQIILNRNMTIRDFSAYGIRPVVKPTDILRWQREALAIYVDPKIERYLVSIIDATRNPRDYKVGLARYVQWGASPRGSIGLYIAAKAMALMRGRSYVTPHEVKEVAPSVLRHRILLNYEGQSDRISTDDVVAEILKRVRVP
ncbi:ATPase [Candidatus Woesearchaeota archaeon CG_4_10_14_0_2_um_filter_57_5]|nr:MAG: ATPase [Candidatus Woesearchaeota archaeon CG1_02_57_44]PIZ50358.1 MAG: ATPase [Candidatus Woesearchaeota archaeon CG_4_10_14_0_2_um_filter_57_5]